MTLRVHVAKPPGHGFARALKETLPNGIEITLGEGKDPGPYEILVAGRPTEGQITASAALRALVIPFAGIPAETRERMTRYPAVSVHNLHHNAVPTAELALALLLAVGKQLVPIDARLRQGDWTPRYSMDSSLLLDGLPVLVLGYGAVGRKVAQLCRGLGMKVDAVRRQAPGFVEDGIAVTPVTELASLLPRSRVLMVTVPATSETEGLLGEDELRALPPGAIIVNVARGPVVDEGALYGALRDGHLAGAGLDVWYRYPESEEARTGTWPAGSPFWELDSVVLSPHRAGHCHLTEVLRATHLAELLAGARDGSDLANRVDLGRGY